MQVRSLRGATLIGSRTALQRTTDVGVGSGGSDGPPGVGGGDGWLLDDGLLLGDGAGELPAGGGGDGAAGGGRGGGPLCVFPPRVCGGGRVGAVEAGAAEGLGLGDLLAFFPAGLSCGSRLTPSASGSSPAYLAATDKTNRT